MQDNTIINFDDAKKLFNENNASHSPDNAINDHVATAPEHLRIEDSLSNNKSARVSEPIKINNKSLLASIMFWVGIIVLAFIIGFTIVNGPAIFKKLSYWISPSKSKLVNSDQILNSSVTVSDSNNSTTSEIIPNNHLIISNIGVDAPIIWNVEEIDVQNEMLKGIVHYKNTATPDISGGNVFLTGHSSNFWWVKSDYNQILTLLPEVKINDNIVVTYNNIKYVYKVYDIFSVNPSQVEVMKTIDGKSTLTVMSCVPIGTNLKRLIVRSELIYKDEGKGIPDNGTTLKNNSTELNSPSTSSEKPIEVNKSENNQPQNSGSDLILPSTP